jgi:ABC-type Zn uptake system ZnuABC Zn-binding protein ZnuA
MNGLGLDEWALELIEGSGGSTVVVELAEDLDGVEYLDADEHAEESEGEASHGHESANPHLWLDVENAARYVDRIAETLVAADSADAPAYEEQATAYRTKLEALDQEIAGRMGAIPAENRRIVSFHEAFPYFAAAYGLEVVGVVVEAPGQDPSAGEIAALVEAIRESGAKAVFSEVQFSDRLARTIADEAGVKVESGLHNDSLGDPPADSYVGMMQLNAERIEAALR